jgi:superoxide reductase
MTEKLQVYKCNVCGNIVEVLHTGKGELVCCGQPMELKEELSEGEYAEKHAPVIEETDSGVKVKIGAVEHPMEEEHYIEWVEIQTSEGACREFLKPGQKPAAEFSAKKSDVKKARMYCNVHGLWKS